MRSYRSVNNQQAIWSVEPLWIWPKPHNLSMGLLLWLELTKKVKLTSNVA